MSVEKVKNIKMKVSLEIATIENKSLILSSMAGTRHANIPKHNK
jgi:hypothetical protein